MYLKKLEIHGFKSFAKKTSFAFEPGITSIVGPNGSGKSNIADSLRWVFGEQSLKLLRGKKTEDVIFAGSDQKARLGGAEVLVYFDNSNRVIPVDYSEVVIARRLFRNGNSEYLINGSQVRLLDIQDLLLGSGVGNTSYCVIGQGMIDNFILGGPQAIKELIEDASGVKPYYIKRGRALRKFEHTEANLTQVKAVTAEIEPRLRSLRRQTRKLEQREDLERELREMQTAYFGQIFRGVVKQAAELNSRVEIFDQQIAQLETEIHSLAADVDQEEQGRAGKDPTVALQAELEDLRKDKQRLLEEQSFIRGKLRVEELKIPQPPVNWALVRDKLKAALEKFRAFVKNFSKYKDEPKSWESESHKIENEFEQLLREIDNGSPANPESQNFEQAKKRLGELNAGVEKISTLITAAEAQIRTLLEQTEQKKNQLFVKERLLRNKQDNLLKVRDQKNSLSIEQAKLQTRRENYEKEAAIALGQDFAKIIAAASTNVPEGIQDKIAHLRKQLEIIGGVDDLVVQEYRETDERFQYLTSQTADLEKAIVDLKTVIAKLDESIKKEFSGAYNKISEKFSEYFRILFGGGKATMTILREKPVLTQTEEESENQTSSSPHHEEGLGEAKGKLEITGIEIRATPPGKKLGGIAALSGGERALTSIALLSAILATFPSPFVVLDEVDAALDEANSIRFAKILETLSAKTQFITITHNRETMRQSHTLYGVTIGEDGVSRVLSLKLEQAAAYSSKN